MTTSLPPPADAARLTGALCAAGVLDTAHVRGVTLMAPPIRKLRSHTFPFRLGYERQESDGPGSVILKMGHLDDNGRPAYANALETAFYRDIAPALPKGLVPRCFEVVAATEASAWHLLLEDLTDSHFIATEWPLP